MFSVGDYAIKPNSIIRFVAAIAAVFLVSGAASFAMTSSGVWDWYNQLNKPSFMPPSWLFGPVWTLLYILMAIAVFLVWERGFQNKKVRTAMGLFVMQLILNGLWTWIFFGAQQIFIAFIEIMILWLAIAVTILSFRKISFPAAILMLPYIVWISFAAVLNASIWLLN